MPPNKTSEAVEASYYECDDKINMTCPADFEGNLEDRMPSLDHLNKTTLDFEDRVYNSLTVRETKAKKDVDVSVAYGQDPNSLTDEEREVLMRKKRKEDAYKTALCESHRRTGCCSYGDSCRFAHGLDELRLPVQPRGRSHPKYKTVLCDKFSVSGYCKYGARCQFIHKITNPLLLKQREDLWKTFSNSNKENIPMFPFLDRGLDLNQSMPLFDSRWRPDRSESGRFSRPVDFNAQWPRI